MSLKDRFDNIKKTVETKKAGDELKEGGKVFQEIGNEKQTLTDKINGLKELLSQLKLGYSASETDLENFKGDKSKIEGLYSEYAEYLKEQGVNSVNDILHNEAFAGDEEVKKYRQAGAAKLDKAGQRGKLGEGVAKLSEAKSRAKATLPDLKLDFRGQVAEGQEQSPRQESILKIQNLIEVLEKEQLASVQERDQKAREQYLPKIKEIITNNINKLPLADRNFSIDDRLFSNQLISQEVFEICGDELWPEVKQMAVELIAEKYRDQGLPSWNNPTEGWLDAEKMVFDVDNLRGQHEKLLELNRDKIRFSRLGRDIEDNFLVGESGRLTVKGDNAYSQEVMADVEYFKEKDPAAKKVCEEVKNKITSLFAKAQQELKPGLLASRENRDDLKMVKSRLDESIKRIEQTEVPEHFYSRDMYDFTNIIGNAIPRFSSLRWDWFQSTVAAAVKQAEAEFEKINELRNKESDRLRKLDDRIYSMSYNRGLKKIKEGGFDVPFLNIKELESYKIISDKKEVDSFLVSLEGQVMSKEEFARLIQKEQAVFEAEIENYPDSEAILRRYEELQIRFKDNFFSIPTVVEEKRRVRKGETHRTTERVDFYEVRHRLFD
jgi:hypothetical protein